MKAVLLSNISHYAYAAEALHHAGYLERMISGPVFAGTPRFLRGLPKARSLIGRRTFPGLEGVPLTRSWLPEMAGRAMSRLNLLDESRRYQVTNRMYDLRALPYVRDCDVFHFVNGIAWKSASRAKDAGALLICDQRSTHPSHEQRVVGEECAVLGIPYRHPESAFMDWVLEEYRMADIIVCASEYAAQTFRDEGVDPSRLRVMPLGCEPAPAQAAKEERGTFTILFVGSIIPRKGVRFLVEAFRRIPDATLFLVGSLARGAERQLDGVDDRARHIPHLSPRELRTMYASSSVLVLPSIADAWGLVALEAMAQGTPVVVSDQVGAAMAVRDGVDGFVVPAGDAGALETALRKLMADPQLGRVMGESARARAGEFSWAAYGRRVVELYDSLDGRGRLPS